MFSAKLFGSTCKFAHLRFRWKIGGSRTEVNVNYSRMPPRPQAGRNSNQYSMQVTVTQKASKNFRGGFNK